jgi:hypothetical protein
MIEIMKLFVSREAHRLGWEPAGNRRPAGTHLALGGRFQRLADLSDWMPTLAALILVTDFLSLVHLPVLLEYLFSGILVGGTIGKGVVVRCERRSGELPPERVRNIEWAWIGIGVLLMAFAAMAQVALALP